MRKMLAAAVATIALAATGCAATYNRNFPLIETGMSMAEVTQLIGQPISAESGPDGSKILFYRLASSRLDTDGSDTREYWVQTMQRQVIGYGERTDAVTMEREARQFMSAWGAANMAADAARDAARNDAERRQQ